MARNWEKAHGLLNRYLSQKEMEGGTTTIPNRPDRARTIEEAERGRAACIRSVMKRVEAIEDDSIGVDRIRSLNEEINSRLREKRRWDLRIRQLGGPDYAAAGDSLTAIVMGGRAAAGVENYLYFGAAQRLPGVAEALAPPRAKRRRLEATAVRREVGVEYYDLASGSPDGLLADEAAAEAAMAAAAAAAEARAAALVTEVLA